MNMRLNVAILILDDLNFYSNEKKQCADESIRAIRWLYEAKT